MLTFIQCFRPRQWTKNVLLFAALIFSHNVHRPDYILRSIAAFFLFSLGAGAVYIVNDILDIARDRNHPVKRNRPIASGKVGTGVAWVLFAVVIVTAGMLSVLLAPAFAAALMIYVALQILYSISLKNIVILDVFIVSFGFLLRVIAGALVIDVPISSWILVCTMLLALFLILSKRRHEITLLEDKAESHRSILKEYSPYLLDQMIGVVTSATLVAYMIFTLSEETVTKFGPNMILTVPFVLYGIFRYLYLVHRKHIGGHPEEVLLTDIPMQLAVVGYAVTAVLVIYF